MTTDRIAEIKFRHIPIGYTFSWNKMSFRKTSETTAAIVYPKELPEHAAKEFSFPPDFGVDMSYTQVTSILGPQTGCGEWE